MKQLAHFRYTLLAAAVALLLPLCLSSGTLATEVLGSALDWALAGRHGAPPNPGPGQIRSVLGSPLEEEGLRLGLERSCRHLARLATDGTERIEWVERANRFRPRTWV